MFSFHKLNDYMFQTFTAECERLTTLLANYTRTGEVIDFQQLMVSQLTTALGAAARCALRCPRSTRSPLLLVSLSLISRSIPFAKLHSACRCIRWAAR